VLQAAAALGSASTLAQRRGSEPRGCSHGTPVALSNGPANTQQYRKGNCVRHLASHQVPTPSRQCWCWVLLSLRPSWHPLPPAPLRREPHVQPHQHRTCQGAWAGGPWAVFYFLIFSKLSRSTPPLLLPSVSATCSLQASSPKQTVPKRGWQGHGSLAARQPSARLGQKMAVLVPVT